MVFLFKDKSIGSVIFLVILCGLVHIHLFLHPVIGVINEDNGLVSFVLRHYSLNILYPRIAPYLYLLIILLQAIRLNWLLNELKMYNISGFTAGLAYILLTAIIPQWTSLSAALIGNSFVIWVFIFLIKLYGSPKPKETLFNTGLLVGFSFLCYHPTIILIPVALFALAVVRPFVLSEWFVLLLGILAPIYIFVSFLFLDDKMFLFFKTLPHFQLKMPINNTDVWLWVKVGAILAMLMIVMLLVMLPIPFVFKNCGLDSAILWIVPLSSFIGNAYLYPKKAWLPNIIFFVSIILVVHTNWVLCK